MREGRSCSYARRPSIPSKTLSRFQRTSSRTTRRRFKQPRRRASGKQARSSRMALRDCDLSARVLLATESDAAGGYERCGAPGLAFFLIVKTTIAPGKILRAVQEHEPFNGPGTVRVSVRPGVDFALGNPTRAILLRARFRGRGRDAASHHRKMRGNGGLSPKFRTARPAVRAGDPPLARPGLARLAAACRRFGASGSSSAYCR